MPQLNPSPWFLMILALWLTINIMMTLTNRTSQTKNLFSAEVNNKTHQKNTWAWPW